MPQLGYGSIRNQSSTLNISKGGSTSIYIDKYSPKASDKNDGFDWDRPKATIGGATAVLEPWMELWINSGIYQENVIIPYENVKIHGVVQSGVNRAEISPLSGVPLKIQAGYCEVEGIALASVDSNVIEVSYPGNKLHDLYVELNTTSPLSYYYTIVDGILFTSHVGNIAYVEFFYYSPGPLSIMNWFVNQVAITYGDNTTVAEVIEDFNSHPQCTAIMTASLAPGYTGNELISDVGTHYTTSLSYNNYSAVYLNDCDRFDMHDCHLNGKSGENLIGVRIDGLINATVDSFIHDNYFVDFGDIGLAGQCINVVNAQRTLIQRNIFDSSYNGVYLSLLANGLTSVVGNQFYANASVDIVDMNPSQIASGNFIRGNFYGYVDWFDDVNHDGIADYPVQCWYNYDYAASSSPHYGGQSFTKRYVA